jgi:hypothetical protein
MHAQTTRAFQSRGLVCGRPCARQATIARAKKEKKSSKDDSNHEEVYIGQGRYVTDDPNKYPSKDSWGTGGWAGGEEGLQKFLEKAAVRSALLQPAEPTTQRVGSAWWLASSDT